MRRVLAVLVVLTRSSLHLGRLDHFSTAGVVLRSLVRRLLLERSGHYSGHLEELVALEFLRDHLQLRLLDQVGQLVITLATVPDVFH